jgi:hypothetical protein
MKFAADFVRQLFGHYVKVWSAKVFTEIPFGGGRSVRRCWHWLNAISGDKSRIKCLA